MILLFIFGIFLLTLWQILFIFEVIIITNIVFLTNVF